MLISVGSISIYALGDRIKKPQENLKIQVIVKPWKILEGIRCM